MTGQRTQLADPRTIRKATTARRMNKSEAQVLTQQIRATAHGLWRLVAEAYDRKAWQALGFESWKDYATIELQMSESRSYQLVDTGRVMKAIAEAAGSDDVFESVVVTARETARVKPYMSTFKQEVESLVKDGMPAAEAVDLAMQHLPGPPERAPRVVEGTVVRTRTEPAPEPEAYEPDPADFVREPAKRVVAAPVPSPFFTGTPPVDQPLPRVPRGKKVCTACDGHGYV